MGQVIPEPEDTLEARIDAFYESRPSRKGRRLGASQLGHPCDRWLWLQFRWAVVNRFPGRMLRLFIRGQAEESIVVKDLESVGCKVQFAGKDQKYFDFGNHMGGFSDGIVTGVPGAPKSRHVLEIKTHNDKSFKAVEKDGVRKAKPEHWLQMQLYMLQWKFKRALYYAVNKNDDRIYEERVEYDKEAAENALARGKSITLTERIPEGVSDDPSWHQCKFCAAHSFCHEERLTREVNCRTCAHVTPMPDNSWYCARWGQGGIPSDFQEKGCDLHVLHPDLVPWELVGSDGDWVAVWKIGDREVKNGEGAYKSQEILANPSACGLPETDRAREEMGGEVVG